MRTKLVAIAALAVAAVTLTAVASAGSATSKQRVAIRLKRPEVAHAAEAPGARRETGGLRLSASRLLPDREGEAKGAAGAGGAFDPEAAAVELDELS